MKLIGELVTGALLIVSLVVLAAVFLAIFTTPLDDETQAQIDICERNWRSSSGCEPGMMCVNYCGFLERTGNAFKVTWPWNLLIFPGLIISAAFYGRDLKPPFKQPPDNYSI